MSAYQSYKNYQIRHQEGVVLSVAGTVGNCSDLPTFFIPAARLAIGRVFRVVGNLAHQIVACGRRWAMGFLSRYTASERFQSRFQLRTTSMVWRR